MTEDQAKEKWCPLAIASHTNPRAGFDGDGRPKQHPCIASQCMAWRWDDIRNQNETHGHCGAFGHPNAQP